MLINGIKFACTSCVKGHRSSNCNHSERPLIEIRKKGRPVSQCSFCRDLRKTKQVHIKCNCKFSNKQQCCSEPKECTCEKAVNKALEDSKRKKSLSKTTLKNATQEINNDIFQTILSTEIEPIATNDIMMTDSDELSIFLNNLLMNDSSFINFNDYCGSLTPHSNCSIQNNPKGESVVITITPISSSNSTTITRIMTCYCGSSCVCPGCFVHPK